MAVEHSPGVAQAVAGARAGRFRGRHYIDAHKALVVPAAIALMAAYGKWDVTLVWIYVGLHGTYTIAWLTKSRLFPDKSFEVYAPARHGLPVFIVLMLYSMVPWIILSGYGGVARPWYIGLCVGLTVLGMFWCFASDMQKTVSLELRPGALVTEHLWSVVRNPNYFGEFMIYLGFTMLAVHWAPLLLLAVFVFGVWWPRMRSKDNSLSRYPEFAAYKARTKLFIPFIW